MYWHWIFTLLLRQSSWGAKYEPLGFLVSSQYDLSYELEAGI